MGNLFTLLCTCKKMKIMNILVRKQTRSNDLPTKALIIFIYLLAVALMLFVAFELGKQVIYIFN